MNSHIIDSPSPRPFGAVPDTATLVHLRGHLLDRDACADVRRACLRSLDRGVAHVLVDLTGVTTVCDEATDVLQAASDELRAKQGALWLASFDRDPEWHVVPAEGLWLMNGVCAALDRALSNRPAMQGDRQGVRRGAER